MVKTKAAFLVLMLALLVQCPVFAEPPEKAGSADEPAQCSEDYSFEDAATVLQIKYDLWLDARLSGSEREAERLEKTLLGMISYDIMVGQERVRATARQIALGADRSGAASAGETDEKVLTPEADEFQRAIDHLNAKEALLRAAVRTEAFSNKYRLLGDYIDLLRRELKMPRLKLARTERPSGGGASPPAAGPGYTE